MKNIITKSNFKIIILFIIIILIIIFKIKNNDKISNLIKKINNYIFNSINFIKEKIINFYLNFMFKNFIDKEINLSIKYIKINKFIEAEKNYNFILNKIEYYENNFIEYKNIILINLIRLQILLNKYNEAFINLKKIKILNNYWYIIKMLYKININLILGNINTSKNILKLLLLNYNYDNLYINNILLSKINILNLFNE
ncbi:hypothetical protein [Candidatus Nardonella dryophthoridicola]|uniref:Hmlg of o Putative negative regulator of RcsB-dependent stress response n=1 Tax=endosymbiont of Rhynchophorus ferrugineus TaxID=1972133 RepID=A0A2Z5T7M8_9GAMM|nr:hypothetical protein [Candidatus Nardonella dryophthoridicola]QTJ62812.1 hypothetical protein JRY34_00720 [Candidatus Nardonella dryophthoridicola]BBA85055.1 hmlg of o Putative negative regulator of RcsB-dependent stress response [endosymbiont of Rhynchophorus ferrugineus]